MNKQNPIKIYHLAGPRGLGVSTQAEYLYGQLRLSGLNVELIKMYETDTPEIVLNTITKIEEAIAQGKSVVIDGTLLKPFIFHMNQGQALFDLESQYGYAINKTSEVFKRADEVKSVVILPETLFSRNGQEPDIKEIQGYHKSQYLLGFRSLNFKPLVVSESDKIININDKILKL